MQPTTFLKLSSPYATAAGASTKQKQEELQAKQLRLAEKAGRMKQNVATVS
jgi:hypothetical protein